MRKGQAAMEYLMTYGWAILVIVVVLAALLYLGVFNVPTPERCQLQTGINCNSFRLVGSSGALSLSLSNGLGKEITVTAVHCTKNTAFNPGTGTFKTTGLTTAIPVGSTVALSAATCTSTDDTTATSGTVGNAYVGKLFVKYYYTDEGSGSPRVNAGDLNVKFQP